MEIFVTRFDNKTISENKIWISNNNEIGCIYGTPIKLSEKLLPESQIIVIEMNNSSNSIEGIGIIKNKLVLHDKKKYKIYQENNYNRFIYKSNMRIDKTSFNNYEKIIINNLEKLLFKSHNHCKRGQGIQHIPKHINENKDFNYKRFLYNMYYNRFLHINKEKLIIKNNHFNQNNNFNQKQ
tara:strand:+ start:832 stop:1374 length:543 start_codon:yes stop_codon:yes gene_type:complete